MIRNSLTSLSTPHTSHRCQIIPQVVEPELAVGHVGDVIVVGHTALLGFEISLDEAHTQTQEPERKVGGRWEEGGRRVIALDEAHTQTQEPNGGEGGGGRPG